MSDSIKTKIERYYSVIKDYKDDEEGGPNTRYKSWEWCHGVFLKAHKAIGNPKINQEKIEQIIDIDYLALHLAFYLASWGMYRGSSYLLQRDYKAHKNAVRIILDPAYNELWDYNPENRDVKEDSKLLFGENGVYWRVRESYPGHGINPGEGDEPTETLMTKILMGTYGCIPAFDRFFKAGIGHFKSSISGRKKCQIGDYKLTQYIEESYEEHRATESFMALAVFACRNKKDLCISNYPIMKCVDMFFWEIGYELSLEKALKSLDSNSNADSATKRRLLKQANLLGFFQKDDESIADQIIKANTNLSFE